MRVRPIDRPTDRPSDLIEMPARKEGKRRLNAWERIKKSPGKWEKKKEERFLAKKIIGEKMGKEIVV